MQLLIVTGMSGAGKSITINALEDIGFYCIDNMPPQLIAKFFELFAQSSQPLGRIAMVVDCRGREMFGSLFETLEMLRHQQVGHQILFLDCEDATLVKRYKETRRKHPSLGGEITRLDQAIQYERHMLEKAKNEANYIIDTTYLSVNQLKEKVTGIFAAEKEDAFLLNFVSFGFKYGLPADCDLIFDVRCLPNPYYVPALKEHTGLEEVVQTYVMDSPASRTLRDKLLDLLTFLLPLYRDVEGKRQVVVGFGCTGGKHRSVTFAQQFSEYFAKKGYNAVVTHRDFKKIKP